MSHKAWAVRLADGKLLSRGHFPELFASRNAARKRLRDYGRDGIRGRVVRVAVRVSVLG